MNKVRPNDFIDLCKKFESVVKTKYGLEDKESPYHYLSNLEEFSDFRNEINIIRTLRNVCQHNKTEIHGKEAFEITSVVYESLKKIIELIEHPLLVKDIYVNNVYFVRMQDLVGTTIHKMKELNISHVPVLDDQQKVIGVFSENTIFTKLSFDEIIEVDKDSTIEEYKNYIKLDSHSSEYFNFVGLNYAVADIKKDYAHPLIGDKRLVLSFVTKTGHSNQKLEGIVTPWDSVKEVII